jgi:DNA-binding beta-propeller fold protein YncE
MKKRWIWSIALALALLLVPAVLWGASRWAGPVPEAKDAATTASPAGLEETPAAQGTAAAAQGTAAAPHEPLLVLSTYYGAGVTVVDAGSGQVTQTLFNGLIDPSGTRLYVLDHPVAQTRIRAVELATGSVAGEIAVAGTYELPWVGMVPGGLSANGRWLALQAPADAWNGAGSPDPNATSRFVVVDASLAGPARPVELPGYFEFDALSDDGQALYLIEYVGDSLPFDHYRVRRYDLEGGRLDPAVVADKRTGEQGMTGTRLAAVPSHDGRWLYSLYSLPDGGGYFVHALDLIAGQAVCIDLDDPAMAHWQNDGLWGLALSPAGDSLYLSNGAAQVVAEIDTAQFAVRRTVNLATQGAGAGGLWADLVRHLLPVAQAKMGPVNPVLVSANGRTLLVLAEKGILAIDTADLSLRARYLPERKLSSLVFSPDRRSVYALDPDAAQLLRLDPDTGQVLSTLDGTADWWAVLAVIP